MILQEFWQRWHISLGTFFRDYVLYLPIFGKRRKYLNLFLVWFCTGFWHGADWTFIIWGLYFAALLLIEKSIPKKIKDKAPAAVSHIYLIFAVLIGFVIFNANGVEGIVSDFRGMFTPAYPLCTGATLYYLRSYAVLFVIGIIGATPAIKIAAEKLNAGKTGEKICSVAEPVIILALLVAVTAYLIDGSYNPFLYFRF